MKSGMDLNQLAAEITRQQASKRDFKAATSELTMRVDSEQGPRLKINGHGEFVPTEICHNQLGAYAGIPAKYYDRMREQAPDLLAENVTYWLEKNKETRLVRTLDGRARAFLSNRYRTIDNVDVAEAVLPVLLRGGNDLGLRIETCNVTESRLLIKAVSERITGTIVGEHVQSGIVISNSEVGLHSFKIEPLVYVLSCTNGAIMNDAAMRRYHVGRVMAEIESAVEVFADDTRKADDKALMLKMRDVVRASFDQVKFTEQTKTLSLTAGNKIERKLAEVPGVVIEQFNLPEKHADGILRALMNHDATQWGLSNAITLYAQDEKLSYDEATELEHVGGEILTMPRSKWLQYGTVSAEVAAA